MNHNTRTITAALAAAILALGLAATASADSKPKKVIGGNASEKEKIQLLDYAISLYETQPKKGDPASWTKLTGNLVAAAAKVAIDPKAGTASLGKALDCKACHNKHKYDKPK